MAGRRTLKITKLQALKNTSTDFQSAVHLSTKKNSKYQEVSDRSANTEYQFDHKVDYQ